MSKTTYRIEQTPDNIESVEILKAYFKEKTASRAITKGLDLAARLLSK